MTWALLVYSNMDCMKKVYHAWTQGALSADDYVHRQPLSTGIIRQIFALDGKYYKGYLLYAQAYWLLIIFGMILSAVRYFKNREMCQIHGIEITIFGLFVFCCYGKVIRGI